MLHFEENSQNVPSSLSVISEASSIRKVRTDNGGVDVFMLILSQLPLSIVSYRINTIKMIMDVPGVVFGKQYTVPILSAPRNHRFQS